MKAQSIVSNLLLGVWILAHFIFCGFAALFCFGLMSLQFTEIHTGSTAMDPIRGLTRETVLESILAATLRWIWVVPISAASVYFINDVIWEEKGKLGKRIARVLSLLCATMLQGAIILADVQCFLKYP